MWQKDMWHMLRGLPIQDISGKKMNGMYAGIKRLSIFI